jgi:hypothetical protein
LLSSDILQLLDVCSSFTAPPASKTGNMKLFLQLLDVSAEVLIQFLQLSWAITEFTSLSAVALQRYLMGLVNPLLFCPNG